MARAEAAEMRVHKECYLQFGQRWSRDLPATAAVGVRSFAKCAAQERAVLSMYNTEIQTFVTFNVRSVCYCTCILLCFNILVFLFT